MSMTAESNTAPAAAARPERDFGIYVTMVEE
jgi:hypothetical protein